MKRILALVIAAAMVICNLFALDVNVYAAETPQIIVGNMKECAGGSVQIPVQIKNNPGITAFRMVLEYDMVIFGLNNVEFKEAAKNFNTGTSQNYGSPYSISGFNSQVDVDDNGIIALFTFEINPNAEPGRYPINFSYDTDDVFNMEGESIYFEVEEGYVDVIEKQQPTAEPTEVPTAEPTEAPTTEPTKEPTEPTEAPTAESTDIPSVTEQPKNTAQPTVNQPGVTVPDAHVQNREPAQSLNENNKILIGNIYYKIIDMTQKTVEVAGVKGSIKKVVIPTSINIEGETYKVTSIAANAFKGNKKIKMVVIGKNIESVGKKAFLKCSSLKKVVIKSLKLRSVGKNAFKKISRKAVLKVPKKKVKKYKSILKMWKVK